MWRLRRARTRDELAFHRDRLIDDYVAGGLDRRAAERRAFLEFGNLASLEEASRDVRGRWIEDGARDVQYALRTLGRSPGFAAATALSLALAIGATSAVFSLVNAVLLRPLPVADPDGLVQITRLTPDGRAANVSFPLFEHLRDHLRSITAAFAFSSTRTTILVDGEPELVSADLVSGAYFDVLGIRPAAGRLLANEDRHPAPEPAAVISDGYWQRRFSRDPSVVGRTVRVADRVFTIVGVLPASFRSVRVGTAPDVVLPLVLMTSAAQRGEATNNFLKLMARLAPGVTIAQAGAEAQGLWQAFIEPIAGAAPSGLRDELRNRRVGAIASPDGINEFRADLGQPLIILMGAVTLVLLLASINVAGLLVARAVARHREISIRLAIGAARGRLLRQFLAESLVLAVIGGGAGLVAAGWLSQGLAVMFVNGRELDLSVAPDWRVLSFTAIVALGVAVLAGSLPALQALRESVMPALRQVRAVGRGRLGRTLVTTQIAISMVLVVCATLFVGSLIKLYAVERGFDAKGVLVVSIRAITPIPAERNVPLVDHLVSSLTAIPGVRSAAAAVVLPVSGNNWTRAIELPADAWRPGGANTTFNAVTPGYFATLGIRVLAGRDFDRRDTRVAPAVAVVNESFARRFFGSQSPIGRRVTSVNTSYDIVGVVGDATYDDLRDGHEETMYVAAAQRATEDQAAGYAYLVRAASGGDPARLASAVASAIGRTDPALQVQRTLTYDTLIDRAIPAERILATLGGLFGVLALVIAGIGIFSMLAFQVARRTTELGVRMALGATRGSIVGLVLQDVAWMLVPGLAAGAAGAALVTPLARDLVFGVGPIDPAVFTVAAAVLTTAALMAAWVPTRRAARVDPLMALRHE
ncbi:MAG: ABC transporter permease [Acidobacteria bacterium]|nr:ABC transporter permease [Acidobacteriota bacterium]